MAKTDQPKTIDCPECGGLGRDDSPTDDVVALMTGIGPKCKVCGGSGQMTAERINLEATRDLLRYVTIPRGYTEVLCCAPGCGCAFSNSKKDCISCSFFTAKVLDVWGDSEVAREMWMACLRSESKVFHARDWNWPEEKDFADNPAQYIVELRHATVRAIIMCGREARREKQKVEGDGG